MTKNEFERKATAIEVTAGGKPAIANPKLFSTGSAGWNINAKVPVTLPDGTTAIAQFSGNLVVVGSKEWAQGSTAQALPAPNGAVAVR